MSLSNLKELETIAQKAVSSGAVQSTIVYLLSPSDVAYSTMSTNLFSTVTDASLISTITAAGFTGIRIVVTLSDGTVVFDSSKSTTVNSHANAVAKTVNSDNHNTRAAILTAIIGQQGVGFEKKYSSTTGKYEQYLAHRVGKSPQDSIGCIRYSCS
ncbi:MAG: hypothetical protein EBY22_14115 [Gammaproteobacteria bacterium]|nr:hypothetical protein [Gammaproteobacteria bacterium]